eukprot:5501727-Pyramimonas_sp.AAC.1
MQEDCPLPASARPSPRPSSVSARLSAETFSLACARLLVRLFAGATPAGAMRPVVRCSRSSCRA